MSDENRWGRREIDVLFWFLVPAEMDETTFWKRYWFRAWQIREAEEKRRALLQCEHGLFPFV